MPLTSRCGRCGRLFPVYAQDLKRRRGRVSCPQCGNRFDGVAALLDEPMGGLEASSGRARLGMGQRGPANGKRASSGGPGAQRAAAPASPARPPYRARVPIQSAGDENRVLWGLVILALTLALVAQAAWWQRTDLLRDPQARHWLDLLCAGLGCQVPAPRLPGTLEMLEPTLTPDPSSGALVLRLSVRNGSTLDQPPPLIDLELFDEQGDLAAARRFLSADYAPNGQPLMAPGETRDLSLAIARPQTETSGFKVRLL